MFLPIPPCGSSIRFIRLWRKPTTKGRWKTSCKSMTFIGVAKDLEVNPAVVQKGKHLLLPHFNATTKVIPSSFALAELVGSPPKKWWDGAKNTSVPNRWSFPMGWLVSEVWVKSVSFISQLRLPGGMTHPISHFSIGWTQSSATSKTLTLILITAWITETCLATSGSSAFALTSDLSSHFYWNHWCIMQHIQHVFQSANYG